MSSPPLYEMKKVYWDIEEYETETTLSNPLHPSVVTILESGIPVFTKSAEKVQNKGIFVLDQYLNLYMASRNQHEIYQHSDFLSGGAIVCAGEYRLKDGKVYKFNNKSGHYEPPSKCLEYVKQKILDSGYTGKLKFQDYKYTIIKN